MEEKVKITVRGFDVTALPFLACFVNLKDKCVNLKIFSCHIFMHHAFNLRHSFFMQMKWDKMKCPPRPQTATYSPPTCCIDITKAGWGVVLSGLVSSMSINHVNVS